MGEQAQRTWLDAAHPRRKENVGSVALRRSRVFFFTGRIALFLALGCCAAKAVESDKRISREYDLKAVLLYNLSQFVEWPASAFPEPNSPFVIGVLGRDPFGQVLDDIVRDEKCSGRSIAVQRFRNAPAVKDCHILFVCASEADDLPRILRLMKGRTILTVADFEGFALTGGMIRLKTTPEGKIHLRINLTAVKAADLTVSAKLLRVAEVVTPPEN